MFEKIVVGVDGTDGGHRALEWSARQAREGDAEVVAVMAIRAAGEFALSVPPFPVDAVAEVRAVFESDWCRPLRDGGIRYRSEVVHGDPAQALCAVVEREHPDVLVVGTHDRGGFTDRLLGSVSYAVSHRAPCPVVVVPPGAAAGRV